MDKLLTVVIPAYNIEKYEEQCLSSFVKPKALPEIEVLVVNDGSSDWRKRRCVIFPEPLPV